MDDTVLVNINVIGFHVEEEKKSQAQYFFYTCTLSNTVLALRSLKQGENGFAAIFNIFAVILDHGPKLP